MRVKELNERTKMFEVDVKLYNYRSIAKKNISMELKKAFPNTKFRITSKDFTGGDSITIRYEAGPTYSKVHAITNKYQEGSVNPYQDMYEVDPNFDGKYGSVKYILVFRDIPETLYEQYKTNRPISGFKDKYEERNFYNRAIADMDF